jgi:dihydroxy-acid dehydratase
VIHLLAIAGRIGVQLELDDWDRLGSELPCLVNLQPSGQYLMEDFYYAGGLPAVMKEIGHLLHTDALTVNGQTIGENIQDAPCWNRDVVRPFAEPFKREAGIAILRGNLAVNGAVIKPSAASPHLLRHRGRAVAFENIEDFKARIGDESLDIDEHCIMVLKNCGPCGYPGMAEVGAMPLPPKMLRNGITDMVRISDARMSGTAYSSSATCLSGSGSRRNARAGANGRCDRARCPWPAPASRRERHRTGETARELDWRTCADTWLVQVVYRSRSTGASRRGSRCARRP